MPSYHLETKFFKGWYHGNFKNLNIGITNYHSNKLKNYAFRAISECTCYGKMVFPSQALIPAIWLQLLAFEPNP